MNKPAGYGSPRLLLTDLENPTRKMKLKSGYSHKWKRNELITSFQLSIIVICLISVIVSHCEINYTLSLYFIELISFASVDSTVKLGIGEGTRLGSLRNLSASCPKTLPHFPLMFSNASFNSRENLMLPHHRPQRGDPRFVPTQKLQQAADVCVAGSRAGPVMAGSNLMFEVDKPRLFGSNDSDRKITPKRLVTAIANQAPDYSDNPQKDEILSTKFIKNSRMDGIMNVFPETETVRTLFNAAAPVADHVSHHSTLEDTWGEGVISRDALADVQTQRGISENYVETVEVKELVWGASSEEKIAEVRRFTEANLKKNYKDVAVCTTAVVNEYIPMATSDYERLMSPMEDESDEWFKLKAELPPGESWVQYPARIMIGDGVTWAVTICSPIFWEDSALDPNAPKEMWACNFQVQPGLVRYLHDIPCPSGRDIRIDVMNIELMVTNRTGQAFEMDDFVELSSWAVAAGYNDGCLSMAAMSWQLTGTAMNTLSSRNDKKWGMPWEEIPQSLQACCLADLKFVRHCVITLYAVMIKNLFPDPDVVLAFTRTEPRGFGVWFGSFLLASLKGVELNDAVYQQAATGSSLYDLFMALRVRDNQPGQHCGLSEHPPARIMLLYDLYGEWPSITQGGCKYLIQARQHFVKQHDLLTSRAAYGWKELYFPLNAEMMQAAVYGITNVEQYDFTKPTRVRLGLGQHPDRISATQFHFGTLTSAQVMRLAKKNDGARREMTYEAARLGFMHADQFLDRLQNDVYFMQWPRSYYLEIQNIVRRATGSTRRHDVPYLKELLIHNARKSLATAVEQYEKIANVQKQRLVRIQHLEEEIARAEDETLPLSTLTYRGQLPTVGAESSRVKGSMRDFFNEERLAEGRAYVPPELGEDETPYIDPDEYFPLGRAPRSSGLSVEGSDGQVDQLEEDHHQNEDCEVVQLEMRPDDGWEVLSNDGPLDYEPDDHENSEI